MRTCKTILMCICVAHSPIRICINIYSYMNESRLEYYNKYSNVWIEVRLYMSYALYLLHKCHYSYIYIIVMYDLLPIITIYPPQLQIRLDSGSVLMPNLKTAPPFIPGTSSQSHDHQHKVYQLCACSNGKLFLAGAHSICAGDESTICRWFYAFSNKM